MVGQLRGGSEALAWQLTALGVQQLQCLRRVAAARPCLEPRPGVPVEDLSNYERLVMLFDQGWQWRPLPSTPAARAALPAFPFVQEAQHGGAAHRIFYTTLEVNAEYLMCLLQPERLAGLGITEVPHGRTREVRASGLR